MWKTFQLAAAADQRGKQTRETLGGTDGGQKICDGTLKMRAVLNFTFYPVERPRLYPVEPAGLGRMSAFGAKAEIIRSRRNVRYYPKRT